ncbi:MAG: DUF1501 domain-containing protein, partial [Rubripirellula sp.]
MAIDRRSFLVASATGYAGLRLGPPRSLLADERGVVPQQRSGRTSGGGKAKSVILFFLCGGASHIDTWDMKPDAPLDYRGPYETISTSVPGMRLNEMHTQLASLAGEFTLINSMSHPGAISNHFDAMHNLLSGQSEKRVQQGVPDSQPYIGSFVTKHRPSKR